MVTPTDNAEFSKYFQGLKKKPDVAICQLEIVQKTIRSIGEMSVCKNDILLNGKTVHVHELNKRDVKVFHQFLKTFSENVSLNDTQAAQLLEALPSRKEWDQVRENLLLKHNVDLVKTEDPNFETLKTLTQIETDYQKDFEKAYQKVKSSKLRKRIFKGISIGTGIVGALITPFAIAFSILIPPVGGILFGLAALSIATSGVTYVRANRAKKEEAKHKALLSRTGKNLEQVIRFKALYSDQKFLEHLKDKTFKNQEELIKFHEDYLKM